MENTYVENKAALPVGAELRQYRIDAVLGAGGFGVTYLASDTDLQAQFAIKEYLPNEFAMREGATVHPKSSANNDDYRWGLERFLQEARELAKFRHANIVRVHQIFEDNNTAYMILDYEEGVSFGEWLNALGRKPTEDELYGILMALLGALETVHARGLLHRDIAPDNIIMRWDGSPVLLDFGAARQAIGERSKSVSAIVKAGYSPPEQYAVHSSQGEYTDIYALSATFYRAINGEAPPEGTWRQTELMTSDSDPMKRLDRSGYGDNFIEALEAGLLVNAKNRPQTIAAWRQMFEDEAGQRRPSPAAEGQAVGVSSGQLAMDNKVAAVKKSKKRLLLGVAAVLLVLGVYMAHRITVLSERSEMVAALRIEDWQTITLEQTEQAIAGGYDVNAKHVDGLTPLHLAAWKNKNPEVIEILLSAGADVSAKADDGGIPLHSAANGNKNPEVIGVLLSAGANVRAKTDDGGTPLHMAAFNNENPEVVGILLSAGADVRAKADNGLTPLHSAASGNKNPEVIRRLLSAGANVRAKTKDGGTPLHTAASDNENPEIVRVLLSAGANMSAKNDKGETPLHMAVNDNENPEIVRTLLSAGADVSAGNKNGVTPLYMAVANENPEVMEILLSAGADVHARVIDGGTPLHSASFNNENPGMIGILLSAGADVNARTNGGFTPLHAAAWKNKNPEIIEALLSAGGEVSANTNEGETPLHLAAYKNENPEIIESLLSAGGEVNAETDNGYTPLHLAAFNNENPEIIRGLLLARGEVGAKTNERETPLHLAAYKNENPEIIRDLLSFGADVNAETDNGYTPLDNAKRGNNQSAINVIRAAGGGCNREC